jgi:hypothetical protein
MAFQSAHAEQIILACTWESGVGAGHTVVFDINSERVLADGTELVRIYPGLSTNNAFINIGSTSIEYGSKDGKRRTTISRVTGAIIDDFETPDRVLHGTGSCQKTDAPKKF